MSDSFSSTFRHTLQFCPNFTRLIFCLIDWFIERGEGEGEGKKHQLVACCRCPNWGPNVQPKHVPWLGFELVTFCFAEQHPTEWATPVRARFLIFILFSYYRITLGITTQSCPHRIVCRSIKTSTCVFVFLKNRIKVGW